MKPTPEDQSEAEPPIPMTRGLYATEMDDGTRLPEPDPEHTLEAETRHLPVSNPSAPSMSAGSDINPGSFSAWSSGSDGPSSQGIYGKIKPDQTLYSKYRVLRQLGAGAMGEVWLVRHVTLKSEHALKVIIPNFAKNAVALMRFQREFEVMASLRHEHAVSIYDARLDEEGGYIDMEYVDGLTIYDVLAAAKKQPFRVGSEPLMPLDWIVRVLDQLCEVLQVAHEKGIVHRDLKPSNMMMVGNRKPGKEYLKVLDFGIAKVRDDPESASGRNDEEDEHKTLGFIGTAAYGSPEQMMAREVDGRSDLYSVGIMLYEFIAGKLPFRGSQWQVMTQNATAAPPSFYETNPQLRPLPEVEHAVLRILAKEPENRPQTARELFEEFREAVEAIQPSGPHAPYAYGSDHDAAPGSSIPPTMYPTNHTGPIVAGPPSTEMGTFLGNARPREIRKPAPDPSSGFGPILESVEPRRSSWGIKIGVAVGLLFLSIVAFGLIYSARRSPEKIEESTNSNGNSIAKTTPVRKNGPSFEAYWPAEFVRASDDAENEIWPSKVRRTGDQVYFVKVEDGIYLPDEYVIVDPKDKAKDGWPRVIVRDEIRFIRIPSGPEWVMGAWDAATDPLRADAPAHPVQLSGFYMQETEVTNGQFEDYLTKYRTDMARPADWDKSYRELRTKIVGTADAKLHPAVNVSRGLALGFAEEMKGHLPTEAQWEYAARSLGQNHPYVWGRTPLPSRDVINVDTESKKTTSPVDAYPKDRTEQGVIGLNGNVQEMCRDAYEAYKTSDRAVVNPCQMSLKPLEDVEFVIRGASYSSIPGECSVTRRDDRKKAAEFAENLGFRLVVECPDTRKPR